MRGEVRIIGGQWRGRKLKVPEVPHLRPTPDRVRETLFNWLHSYLPGANCLDAFAGTGVLGFEALSRGAAHVVFVDDSDVVISELKKGLAVLKTDKAEIYRAKVPTQLKKPDKLFDIVFLDPPYQNNLLLPTCFHLENEGYLAANAYIYLESSIPLTEDKLPPHWRIIKSKKAGQVAYHLIERLI